MTNVHVPIDFLKVPLVFNSGPMREQMAKLLGFRA